jgi:hypothetical protein
MKSHRIFILFIFILIILNILPFAVFAKGDNLCSSAVLLGSSGFINNAEQDIFAFDGNIDTKWCATYDNIIMNDETKAVIELGYLHWIALDLGESRYFDSYKLYHASCGSVDYGVYKYNAVAWALQTSDDGKNWMTVSEFSDNYEETTEVYTGTRQARYVRLMISQPEADGGTTVRLPEFELYECAAGDTAAGIVGELWTETEAATEAATDADIIIQGYIPETAGDLTKAETGTQITGIHIIGIIITALAALSVGVIAFSEKRKPVIK